MYYSCVYYKRHLPVETIYKCHAMLGRVILSPALFVLLAVSIQSIGFDPVSFKLIGK